MIDHVLAIAFAVGFPLITTRVYLRRKEAMLAGDGAVRRREYWETIAWLSAMGIATVLVWLVLGRDFRDLGLSFEGRWQEYASVVVVTLIGGLLMLQARAVRRDPATREAARESLEPVREFLPATRDELRLFRGVSLSAGVGEEIYYRGFLLWYLVPVVPLVWALVFSSVLFGCAHIMHGMQATIRATVIGAVLAGLYLVSGSLWASMLLHFLIDLSSGEAGFAAFGDLGGGRAEGKPRPRL